jgi:hypothetical protein
LQAFDAILDVRLLVAAGGLAETRGEVVMAGQSLVAGMQAAFASLQDLEGDGGRVVPPDFARHAGEELEGLEHAVQNGLGLLAGQGDGEGEMGVRPGHQEDGHEASALGKIDGDVTEIALGTRAGRVAEWEEGFSLGAASGLDVAPNLITTSRIAILLNEALVELGGEVALLGRCLQVVLEDLADDGLERS